MKEEEAREMVIVRATPITEELVEMEIVDALGIAVRVRAEPEVRDIFGQ